MEQTRRVVQKFRLHIRKIQIISGITIVIIGVLLITNRMFYLAIWAQQKGLFLDIRPGMSAQPDLLLAFLAGIISFLSPCVFPLVPAYIGYLSGHALHEKEADQHYRETLK